MVCLCTTEHYYFALLQDRMRICTAEYYFPLQNTALRYRVSWYRDGGSSKLEMAARGGLEAISAIISWSAQGGA